MRMGRKRKNPLGLPDRVYEKHGAFYYYHKNGPWERLGTDINEAKRKGNLYNDPENTYGSMAYYLDAFVVFCEKRVQRGDLAQRTYEDYRRDIEPLKGAMGSMLPTEIMPKHIGQYLDAGIEMNRAVRANREKSCLSACFSWLVRTGEGFVVTNPCIGVRRNKETPRERYIENHDFQVVRRTAVRQVRGLMDLVYRTLQRPEDILKWTPANIINKQEPDGKTRRVLRFKQEKTSVDIDLAITPEIDRILRGLRMQGVVTGPGMTFIHRTDGKPYTYDGLSSMLRRYIKKLGIESFGFYDLKGKGATDMWLAGVPLEQIQVLCGHESVTTTEIYVKSRWRGTVEPNQVLNITKLEKY